MGGDDIELGRCEHPRSRLLFPEFFEDVSPSEFSAMTLIFEIFLVDVFEVMLIGLSVVIISNDFFVFFIRYGNSNKSQAL